MEKNYKSYWKILKEKKILQLSFDYSGHTTSEINYQISLWKSGISKCKSRDHKFTSDNPNLRISYGTTALNEKQYVLVCTLISDDVNIYEPVNGPKIIE